MNHKPDTKRHQEEQKNGFLAVEDKQMVTLLLLLQSDNHFNELVTHV